MCPKCGSRNIEGTWHEGKDGFWFVLWECKGCSWTWSEAR